MNTEELYIWRYGKDKLPKGLLEYGKSDVCDTYDEGKRQKFQDHGQWMWKNKDGWRENLPPVLYLVCNKKPGILQFDFIDKFADSFGEDIDKNGFHGMYTKIKYLDKDIILFKPFTYMNNSGVAIKEIKDYFKIDINNIVIIHDDMDFSPGIIRLKESGSSAGHNGIKSIINYLGTEKFKRLRIGIGKFQYNIIDYVLTKPSKEDQEKINAAYNNGIDALKLYLKESFEKAMSFYNKKDESN